MRPDYDPIERLAALAARAEAEFEAIRRRQSERMQCRAGCSACCRCRLSVTRVEEAYVRRGLATLSEARRAELSERTHEPARETCPALDDDGRCAIYPFRPVICRTYGAPLRHRRAVALVNPPVVDVCDLNFTDTPLALLPPEDVYDQTSLVETLEAIDRDYREAHGRLEDQRVPIARILRGDG